LRETGERRVWCKVESLRVDERTGKNSHELKNFAGVGVSLLVRVFISMPEIEERYIRSTGSEGGLREEFREDPRERWCTRGGEDLVIRGETSK